MENDESKPDFQIRPPRLRRTSGDETWAWNRALKQIMHVARMSRSTGNRRGATGGTRQYGQHEFKQRCAVRITYAPNRMPGQWKSHGHYLARESATPDQSNHRPGFGPSDRKISIAAALNEWQVAGDQRLFKLIISPEFGDRLDLEKLTRELLRKMEGDLGTRLEWVATIHENTQFPHVHVALRGIREDGRSLRLDRDYVKHGIRANAQDIATAEIGYRTKLDAQEGERREIDQQRFTSLDRILSRNSTASAGQSHVAVDLTAHKDKVRHHALQSRLLFLNSMGLAEKTGRKTWQVRADFETVLRAMQRTSDRQRAIAANAVLLSDNRLQIRMTDVSKVEHLEGRVLGHGEEESTGRTYMLLEGTDRNVHFIYHTPQIARARQSGQFEADSFLRVATETGNGKAAVKIEDLGDSKRLLTNREYFHKKALSLISSGILPAEGSLGGWLGRYEATLARVAQQVGQKSLKVGSADRKRDR